LRLIVQPYDEDHYFFHFYGAPMKWNWQEKSAVLGDKTCPSASLSTTNPTQTHPG
jgi:hypothetical protein